VVSLPKHFAGKGELACEEDAHAALTARMLALAGQLSFKL